MEKVTAVFDIGKTNKKFFLFNKNFEEVYREYVRFEEIKDEDGHPTEDIHQLQTWIKKVFDKILFSKNYNVQAINFSSYGASLVHIDYNGNILTPLYNYTKLIDPEIIDSFYEKYGPELDFSAKTGSTKSGMLNAGMQLYWLKYSKPEVFKKVRYSLHLPQYLSYIFTGLPVSEHTSIGCHTSLWNYEEKDYHDWVYKEKIHLKLPPIVPSETSFNMNYNGKRIRIGVGIHDSSSALLTYIRSSRKKFLLVSTGTWSVSLNPFHEEKLTKEDITNNCINYMRINGKAVRASRLCLGNEYKYQVNKLSTKFGLTKEYHKNVKFNLKTFYQLTNDFSFYFRWQFIDNSNAPIKTTITHANFEEAYHQLMIELILKQVKSIKTATNNSKLETVYVDGGFSDNEIYINLLSHYLREMKLKTTDSSLGSALGAAIVISDTKLNSKFLKVNYALKKHVQFIVK